MDEVSVGGVLGCGLLVAFVLGGGLYDCPRYDVYAANMSGQAKLAEANNSREIAVREAQAKKDAATLLADAEVERAKGVAPG